MQDFGTAKVRRDIHSLAVAAPFRAARACKRSFGLEPIYETAP
jgi:hypothetical protein